MADGYVHALFFHEFISDFRGTESMPQFTVNPMRFDPYKNFKFRVKWDGRYVAGVSKVSALKRTTEVVEHREGGDPSTFRRSPGLTKFEAITLERGMTHDTEFENWAGKVWRLGAGLGSEVSLEDFRKDIIIDVFNEAGQRVLSYKVYRCWVSEYAVAIPELDANANAETLLELVRLENEGWERDTEVTEPKEPTIARTRIPSTVASAGFSAGSAASISGSAGIRVPSGMSLVDSAASVAGSAGIGVPSGMSTRVMTRRQNKKGK